MTIIAGFPTIGFVVLGADGEEGGSYAKSHVRKIATIDAPDYKCLIGGAGHGDFIDVASQQIERDLAGMNSPITLDIMRLCIEDVVTEVFVDRIGLFPLDQRDQLDFELLCAIWAKDSAKAQLIRVGRAVSLVRSEPDVIGKGSHLARYLIDTLRLDDLHRRNCERLCAYLLAKVKAHIKDCGGETQILVLSDDGTIEEVHKVIVREDEESADLVMSRAARWLFHWTDPVGWKMNLVELDRVIDDTGVLLKKELRRHLAEVAHRLGFNQTGPPAPQSPKDDSKSLPPSPE